LTGSGGGGGGRACCSCACRCIFAFLPSILRGWCTTLHAGFTGSAGAAGASGAGSSAGAGVGSGGGWAGRVGKRDIRYRENQTNCWLPVATIEPVISNHITHNENGDMAYHPTANWPANRKRNHFRNVARVAYKGKRLTTRSMLRFDVHELGNLILQHPSFISKLTNFLKEDSNFRCQCFAMEDTWFESCPRNFHGDMMSNLKSLRYLWFRHEHESIIDYERYYVLGSSCDRLRWLIRHWD
jgi:hypothetical protein